MVVVRRLPLKRSFYRARGRHPRRTGHAPPREAARHRPDSIDERAARDDQSVVRLPEALSARRLES